MDGYNIIYELFEHTKATNQIDERVAVEGSRVLYEQSYFWISRTDENTLKTNPGTALFCTYVQGVGVRGPAECNILAL